MDTLLLTKAGLDLSSRILASWSSCGSFMIGLRSEYAFFSSNGSFMYVSS